MAHDPVVESYGPELGIILEEATRRNIELIEASAQNDLNRVRALLAKGALATHVQNKHGTWGAFSSRSALHAAIKAKPALAHEDAEWVALLEVLLEAKADVNAMRKDYDWRGCGVSTTAFDMVLPSAMQNVHLLEMFLNAGASANTRSEQNVHSMNTDGRSVHFVLHTAIRGHNLEIVRAFLDAGADVDAVHSEHFDNERGFSRHLEETGLHIACAYGDLAMCALLLARGADVPGAEGA